MILQIIQSTGLNAELLVDIAGLTLLTLGTLQIINMNTFKGLYTPMLKCKLTKKHNTALIDLGGIGVDVITYPRSSNNLTYKYKDDQYDWTIPKNIERVLPNDIRFIQASTHYGSAYNIHVIGDEAQEYKRMLSPKMQANTIDDRAKTIAEKLYADINKPLIIGAGIGIIIIVAIFGYLILMKGMEYDVAKHAIQASAKAAQATTSTIPPLD